MLELLCILVALLSGYLWGRHDGRRQGYIQAEAILPIKWRQLSFEQGQCALCQPQLMLNDTIEPQ